MKVTVAPDTPCDRIWLVDWEGLAPFWKKDPYHFDFEDKGLKKAYCAYWFYRNKQGMLRLTVGFIEMNHDQSFGFSNGRHRTNVMAQGMRYVPLSAPAPVYRNKQLAPFFIKKLTRDEIIEIPDYPICGTHEELQKLKY
ncbi:MAG: hypothetical protein LBV12_10055 [Puniceicoccales bacterium]|jgi:hypothetical protein|nr:hypothetical protein [Puniceicoccales bacterium]